AKKSAANGNILTYLFIIVLAPNQSASKNRNQTIPHQLSSFNNNSQEYLLSLNILIAIDNKP
ncbi:MAG: hypothetical protein LUQ06_03270, partial [Methylococcaceae bacterium]|nr:hypothetical protein [Methylococcaceae bacterium]